MHSVREEEEEETGQGEVVVVNSNSGSEGISRRVAGGGRNHVFQQQEMFNNNNDTGGLLFENHHHHHDEFGHVSIPQMPMSPRSTSSIASAASNFKKRHSKNHSSSNGDKTRNILILSLILIILIGIHSWMSRKSSDFVQEKNQQQERILDVIGLADNDKFVSISKVQEEEEEEEEEKEETDIDDVHFKNKEEEELEDEHQQESIVVEPEEEDSELVPVEEQVSDNDQEMLLSSATAVVASHSENQDQEKDEDDSSSSSETEENKATKSISSENDDENTVSMNNTDPLKVVVKPNPDGSIGGAEFGGTFDGNTVKISAQIKLPKKPILQFAPGVRNFWPLTSILKSYGWVEGATAIPSRVNMFFTKGSVPPRLIKGSQFVNSIGLSGCIGGAKTLQLSCRRRFADALGCKYDDMHIQPAQYNMMDTKDCERFFRDASKPELAKKIWLAKPSYTYHGAGITLHYGISQLVPLYGSCSKPNHLIIMEYVDRPATMQGGYKFDFRTYLLVASLKPRLVFYHDGFARKSEKIYDPNAKNRNVHITNTVSQSNKDHFYNFTFLSHSLQTELGFKPTYITELREYLKRTTRFLFEVTKVQPKPLSHFPGRFQLFGLDWMLDADGGVHFLEGNGHPLVTHYRDIDLTPRVWEEMVDLILKIHTDPGELSGEMTVAKKFSHGGWHLVYNELEDLMDIANGRGVNSCDIFGILPKGKP